MYLSFQWNVPFMRPIGHEYWIHTQQNHPACCKWFLIYVHKTSPSQTAPRILRKRTARSTWLGTGDHMEDSYHTFLDIGNLQQQFHKELSECGHNSEFVSEPVKKESGIFNVTISMCHIYSTYIIVPYRPHKSVNTKKI